MKCIFNQGISFHIEHLKTHNLQQCWNEVNRLGPHKTKGGKTRKMENILLFRGSATKVVGLKDFFSNPYFSKPCFLKIPCGVSDLDLTSVELFFYEWFGLSYVRMWTLVHAQSCWFRSIPLIYR